MVRNTFPCGTAVYCMDAQLRERAVTVIHASIGVQEKKRLAVVESKERLPSST